MDPLPPAMRGPVAQIPDWRTLCLTRRCCVRAMVSMVFEIRTPTNVAFAKRLKALGAVRRTGAAAPTHPVSVRGLVFHVERCHDPLAARFLPAYA